MFARAVLLAALAMPQILPITVPINKPRKAAEQARAPIERMGPRWAAACKDAASDDQPGPPVRIHGNTYYVGTCGIASILITDPAGHILIDGGSEADADSIAANIRALGFKVGDIRFILHSHEHFDHVGGIARLQKLSGANLIASAPAAKVFATGAAGAGDPQAGMHAPFPAATVGRVIADGGEVRLGDMMVKAIATPGHTPGALSWRWVSCDGGVCRTIVYADSLTPVSRDNYRFTDHLDVVAQYRSSIAKIATGECDILITPHPSASGLAERFAAGKPLLDEQGCKAYAVSRTKLLDDRLAKEAAGK